MEMLDGEGVAREERFILALTPLGLSGAGNIPTGITSDGERGRLGRAVHHGLGCAGVTPRVPQLRVGDAEVPDGLLLQEMGEHNGDSVGRRPITVRNSAGFGFGWLGCGGGEEVGDGKGFHHG